MNTVEIPAYEEEGARHEGKTTERLRDERTFARLSRRYAQLSHRFSADDQRESASLQAPLMELYVRLYPKSGLNKQDDFDMIMRASRRLR
jgi:hypothetical protein